VPAAVAVAQAVLVQITRRGVEVLCGDQLLQRGAIFRVGAFDPAGQGRLQLVVAIAQQLLEQGRAIDRLGRQLVTPNADAGRGQRERKALLAGAQAAQVDLAFQHQAGQVGAAPQVGEFIVAGRPRRAEIHGEGAEHAAVAGVQRQRPAGAQAMAGGELTIRRPVGVARDVGGNYRQAGGGGGAATAHARADRHAVDGCVERVRQVRRGADTQVPALLVEQQDRTQHARDGVLEGTRHLIEQGRQRFAAGQPFE